MGRSHRGGARRAAGSQRRPTPRCALNHHPTVFILGPDCRGSKPITSPHLPAVSSSVSDFISPRLSCLIGKTGTMLTAPTSKDWVNERIHVNT